MDRISYTGIYGRVFRRNYAKILLQLLVLVVGPIRAYGLYHYDIITDVLQTYNFFANCQWKYAIGSILIMLSSYVTTVCHLIFSRNQETLVAIRYPYFHT